MSIQLAKINKNFHRSDDSRQFFDSYCLFLIF